MAIFEGPRVEIVERSEANTEQQNTPCEEFQSNGCEEKTVGRTCHQFVGLQPGIPFNIKLTVEDVFDWEDANGLRLKIDFDNRDRVYDAEIFITRKKNIEIYSAFSFKDDSTVSIGSLTHLVGSLEDEEVPFRTALLPDEPGIINSKGTPSR